MPNYAALVIEAEEFELAMKQNPEHAKRASVMAIALPVTWKWVYDLLCSGLSEEDIENAAVTGHGFTSQDIAETCPELPEERA